ncbi:hypothetical protein KIN20_000623 [Parelaphostrongylus tenuis]|uniref:Uncharacterized protein n=1 Tax=Parelaphostrongylus tenuis TaxID=148309 RepID=A0AAD5LST9_PARTN|nr:hypothetical protein KIN20_000623 [Parelaphostrongylus tenuis]
MSIQSASYAFLGCGESNNKMRVMVEQWLADAPGKAKTQVQIEREVKSFRRSLNILGCMVLISWNCNETGKRKSSAQTWLRRYSKKAKKLEGKTSHACMKGN